MIKAPAIAAFLISTACFVFASVYALIVYRIRKAKEQFRKHKEKGEVRVDINMGPAGHGEFMYSGNTEQPSFRQVSTLILKNGKWVKEE